MDYEQFSKFGLTSIVDRLRRIVELNYGHCDEGRVELDTAYMLLNGLYDTYNSLALYQAIQEHAPTMTIDKYGRFIIPVYPHTHGTRCRLRIVMDILRTYYEIIGVKIE